MERKMSYEPLVTLYRDEYNINYYIEITGDRIVILEELNDSGEMYPVIVILEELNDSGEMYPVVDFYRYAKPAITYLAYSITKSLLFRITGLYQLTETQRINDEEKIFRSLHNFFANI